MNKYLKKCQLLTNIVMDKRKKEEKEKRKKVRKKKQGRIHCHQLQTGGQGRICAFTHFLTRADGRTDGRTKPLLELRVRN